MQATSSQRMTQSSIERAREHEMPRARTAEPAMSGITKQQIHLIVQRARAGDADVEIAESLRLHPRTVHEIRRAKLATIPAISERVGLDRAEGGIRARVAARVSMLPEASQERLVRRLVGAPQMDGIALIQEEERRCGMIKRGRKPSRFQLAPGTRTRCDRLRGLLQVESSSPDRNLDCLQAVGDVLDYLEGTKDLEQVRLGRRRGRGPSQGGDKKTL